VNIAIVTCDGFNEIDSFVSSHILNRVQVKGWNVAITCPTETVQSQNGVRVAAQRPLEFANEADVVLFGGSPRTREIVEDRAIMSRLHLDPRHQLIGSQCAGALFPAKLGLLASLPVCTTPRTRPLLEAMGVRVLDQAFFASGNLASAGGCLASPYLAAWVMMRLAGRDTAETVLASVAPVGEKAAYANHALGVVSPFVTMDAETVAVAV
jgi:transcriptional regulator GlxA family with amidase domain